MATTDFITEETIVTAEWLNEADALVHDIFSAATTDSEARTNLGVAIGSDVQAWDADLDALAGLTSAANKIPMFSGSETATVIDFLDEDTMTSDSTTATCTQQSIKAYVDTEVAAGPGLSNIVEDTTPQLGGNLDINGQQIVTTSNGDIAIIPNGTGGVGIMVATTTARLEIEEGGFGGNTQPIVKITQDDFDIWALVIGNDTFDTSDIRGLNFKVDDSGTATIKAAGSLLNSEMILATETTANALYILPKGDIGINCTPNAKLEIEDGETTQSVLLKVTADDQSPFGMVIGNDTFSVSDIDGLALNVSNAGVSNIDARGSGASIQLMIAGTAAITINNDLSSVFTLPDNIASAMIMKQGSDTYINVETTNSSEALTFGNSTTNPNFTFSGTGDITASGDLLLDVAEAGGGSLFGNPSGGAQGAGTVNADGLFVDGVAVATTANVIDFKHKTATETVTNSTTFQDDDHLAGWTLDAASYYSIKGVIAVVGPSAADFRCAFARDNAEVEARISYYANVNGGTSVDTVETSLTGGATGLTVVTSNTTVVLIEGYVQTHATLTTTVDFQWAQDTADATGTTVRNGSYIQFTKIS